MVQGLDADKSAQLQAGLARVRERFILSLEDRIDEFYELLEYLADDGCRGQACAEIRARAHKLHGIAGSVGFARMGALAAQLEQHIDLLRGGPTPNDTEFVQELLNVLLDEMEQSLDAP